MSETNSDIKELWQSGDDMLRSVAADMIAGGLPGTLGVCLDILGTCLPGEEYPVILPIQAARPYLRGGFMPADDITDHKCNIFHNLQQDYDGIIAELRQFDETRLRTAYRFFDGLRTDILKISPDLHVEDIRRYNEVSCDGHQLMVFVTGLCNLKCSYCFSSDIERHEIPLEDLEKIFRWAAGQGCTVVTPCGGEPLMYRHIGAFLDLVSEYGMRTYFASNCTYPLSELTESQLGVIDLITFHLTSSLWARPEYMRIFCDNIELAQRRGIDIIARANIVHPDIDIDRWFTIVDKYGLKRMNVALTIPSGAHDNEYIDTRLFSDYVPVVKRLMAECRRRRVNLSFAKPIPPCVFSDEDAADMLRYENFQPVCNVGEDSGTRNVCISPDMKMTPCLGVPVPEVAFNEKMTWQEVSDGLGAEVVRALRKPLFEKCRDCFLYYRRLCQGACLSYKY